MRGMRFTESGTTTPGHFRSIKKRCTGDAGLFITKDNYAE